MTRFLSEYWIGLRPLMAMNSPFWGLFSLKRSSLGYIYGNGGGGGWGAIHYITARLKMGAVMGKTKKILQIRETIGHITYSPQSI